MGELLRPRVLLVDDHAEVLTAVRSFLTPDCEVVGELTNGLLAVEAAVQLRADIVIVDLNMPEVSGLDVCERLVQKIPGIRVVILTAMVDDAVSRESFRRGASAFVGKFEMGVKLLPAIAGIFPAASSSPSVPGLPSPVSGPN